MNIISKPDVQKYNNTIYIPGETIIIEVPVPSNDSSTPEIITIKTISYKVIDLPLIYFPHLILAFIMVLISVGGYLKSRKHFIISTVIALIGPIELISYGILGLFAYFQTKNTSLLVIAAIAFGCNILENIGFLIYYKVKISKDRGHLYWKIHHSCNTKLI